ncbi:tetraspanin-11 [Tripterygium wilfordii]|uniref:Tetraspanin-11 n=2 Tax=Tripterygium wilfordii TaxID=458696 RepID=A0A7J7C7W8_TRIWF|nr:tetraspanin-11 [Tripterygium wilfordii]
MGSCCKINFLLNFYLFVLVLMILGLLALTGFVFAITHEGGSTKAVEGIGFKEYRVQDYSDWLQKHFTDGKTWRQIRSCLVDAQVCSSLSKNVVPEASEFYKMKMSPIQSGCCKPPMSCGFEYKNATFWTVPESGLKEEGDHDCISWSNHQDTLCYDCLSCKGGVLAFIKKEWRFFAYFNLALLVFFNLILSMACCARRNNIEDQGYRRYRGYHW